MNADLWPHVWVFRAWTACLAYVLPFDPFTLPNLEVLEP